MLLVKKTLVKICGVRTPDTLSAALDAGADMIGFVVFEASPRHVDIRAASALRRRMKSRAKAVVLTVDADDERLDRIMWEVAPDMLQLHGAETPARVAAVKARYHLPVMKAIGVAAREDLAALPAFASVADAILLDAKPLGTAVLPGGNGQSFDWTILSHLDPALAFMLSGGLTPSNVAEAIRVARPAGVDVSSGVESSPGVKSPELIRAFLANARAAFDAMARAVPE